MLLSYCDLKSIGFFSMTSKTNNSFVKCKFKWISRLYRHYEIYTAIDINTLRTISKRIRQELSDYVWKGKIKPFSIEIGCTNDITFVINNVRRCLVNLSVTTDSDKIVAAECLMMMTYCDKDLLYQIDLEYSSDNQEMDEHTREIYTNGSICEFGIETCLLRDEKIYRFSRDVVFERYNSIMFEYSDGEMYNGILYLEGLKLCGIEIYACTDKLFISFLTKELGIRDSRNYIREHILSKINEYKGGYCDIEFDTRGCLVNCLEHINPPVSIGIILSEDVKCLASCWKPRTGETSIQRIDRWFEDNKQYFT